MSYIGKPGKLLWYLVLNATELSWPWSLSRNSF